MREEERKRRWREKEGKRRGKEKGEGNWLVLYTFEHPQRLHQDRYRHNLRPLASHVSRWNRRQSPGSEGGRTSHIVERWSLCHVGSHEHTVRQHVFIRFVTISRNKVCH